MQGVEAALQDKADQIIRYLLAGQHIRESMNCVQGCQGRLVTIA